MPDYTFYFIVCGIFFVIGLALLAQAIPYLQNNVHKDIPPITQSYHFEKIPTWIRLTYTTKDALMADNTINIEARTLNAIDLDKIQGIDLILVGAEKSMSNQSITYPEPPSANATGEDWNRYRTDLDNYIAFMNALAESQTSNILKLDSEMNYSKVKAEQLEMRNEIKKVTNNTVVDASLFSVFTGSIENVTYSSGGNYDIGVTLHMRSGQVLGYGMSDLSYVIKDAVNISPTEVKLQIENNNIMVGLGWLGASLVLFALFGTALLEIIKKFTGL